MAHSNVTNERRSAPRTRLRGAATLWRMHRVLDRYALCDLSVRGCAVRGPRPVQPGKLYHAVLCIEAHRHCLRVSAWVARQVQHSPLVWSLGLRFFEPISCFVPELSARMGRVLVAHPSPSRRGVLGAALIALGYEAVEVGSQTEAIWELENGPADYLAAFVADTLSDADGQTLLYFLQTFYPSTRRVLLSGQTTTERLDPCDLAHATLRPPFTKERLDALLADASAFYPSPPTSKYGSSGSATLAHSEQNRT